MADSSLLGELPSHRGTALRQRFELLPAAPPSITLTHGLQGPKVDNDLRAGRAKQLQRCFALLRWPGVACLMPLLLASKATRLKKLRCELFELGCRSCMRVASFPPQLFQPLHCSTRPRELEVDKSPFDIRRNESHPKALADLFPFETTHEFSFRGEFKQTDPGALVGGAGHDGVELPADLRLEEQGGGGLHDLALHLLCRIGHL